MSNLGNRELTPEEFDAFTEALTKAFSNEAFDTMLLKKLKRARANITTVNGYENIVPYVIRRFEQENKTQELLEAALAERPENSDLLAFAERFGISAPALPRPTPLVSPPPGSSAPVQAEKAALEQQIKKLNKDIDPALLRTRLEQYEKQICRITFQVGSREKNGTGFLLRPDVVITNFHIVKEIINNPTLADRVTLYFDYKLQPDGKKIDMGTPYKLAKDWLLDCSENSSFDLQYTEQVVDTEPHCLDYAVLRLAKSVREARSKGTGERTGIEIPETEYEFEKDSPIIILHHPDGGPLKLSWDSQSVLSVNGNKTRVRYSTNTEKGSSGAPCLNNKLELVAIHQSGDDFHPSPQYNQGIPICTIAHRLEALGKKNLFKRKKKR